MLLLICSRHFTARRYVSAVYAVVGCLSFRPSVCLSQTGIVSKRLEESSWVFLPWRLYCKEIRVYPRVLPSGTLAQTQDLQNFATASQSRCQQNSSTMEPVDHGRRAVAVYCTYEHVRMATTLLKGEESTRDNHLLAGNFATDFEFFLLTDSTINLFKFDYWQPNHTLKM